MYGEGGHPVLMIPLAFETFGRWGEDAIFVHFGRRCDGVWRDLMLGGARRQGAHTAISYSDGVPRVRQAHCCQLAFDANFHRDTIENVVELCTIRVKQRVYSITVSSLLFHLFVAEKDA